MTGCLATARKPCLQSFHLPSTPNVVQTYEGGLGGEPYNEAHGGYTFCGVAALALVGRLDAIDLPALARWVLGGRGGG